MKLPTKGNHPCFGQRQGWCNSAAIWRLEGKNVIFHFCDVCKERKETQALAKGGAFIEMPEAPKEPTKQP